MKKLKKKKKVRVDEPVTPSIRTAPVLRKLKPCVVNVRYAAGIDYVYVGRPGRYGNPFIVGVDGTRSQVIKKFRKYLTKKPKLVARAKRKLNGKNLGCHCAPLSCHADVWLEIVNGK